MQTVNRLMVQSRVYLSRAQDSFYHLGGATLVKIDSYPKGEIVKSKNTLGCLVMKQGKISSS